MSKGEPRLIKPAEAPGRETSGGGDLKFFVQQDGLTCGTFTMPPGTRLSAKEMTHPGDEVYFVAKGPAYCDLPDEGLYVRLMHGSCWSHQDKRRQFFHIPVPEKLATFQIICHEAVVMVTDSHNQP